MSRVGQVTQVPLGDLALEVVFAEAPPMVFGLGRDAGSADGPRHRNLSLTLPLLLPLLLLLLLWRSLSLPLSLLRLTGLTRLLQHAEHCLEWRLLRPSGRCGPRGSWPHGPTLSGSRRLLRSLKLAHKPANAAKDRDNDKEDDPEPVLFQRGLALGLLRTGRTGDGAPHFGVGLNVLNVVVVHDPEVALAERLRDRLGHLGLGQHDLGAVVHD
jgi:hypothetical protein